VYATQRAGDCAGGSLQHPDLTRASGGVHCTFLLRLVVAGYAQIRGDEQCTRGVAGPGEQEEVSYGMSCTARPAKGLRRVRLRLLPGQPHSSPVMKPQHRLPPIAYCCAYMMMHAHRSSDHAYVCFEVSAYCCPNVFSMNGIGPSTLAVLHIHLLTQSHHQCHANVHANKSAEYLRTKGGQ
jgi:hypothetical protein